jgi:hypothetical protein
VEVQALPIASLLRGASLRIAAAIGMAARAISTRSFASTLVQLRSRPSLLPPPRIPRRTVRTLLIPPVEWRSN